MKRIIILALSLLGIVGIVLLVYLFYRGSFIGKFIPIEWSGAVERVSKDCRTTTYAGGDNETGNYLKNLLEKSKVGIKFSEDGSASGYKELTARRISKEGNTYCWIVGIGFSGNRNYAIFENSKGEIEKLKIGEIPNN